MINNIKIATVQLAVNTEENEHLLKHPLGSISRTIPELISQILNFIGIESSSTNLINDKGEEGVKQLIYTTLFESGQVKELFPENKFDYYIYGEIDFDSDIIKVEISLLSDKTDKVWKRSVNTKKYDFLNISKLIVEEILKILEININLEDISFINNISTNNLTAWEWYSVAYETELNFKDKEEALTTALKHDPEFLEAKLKLLEIQMLNKKKSEAYAFLEENYDDIKEDPLNFHANNLILNNNNSEASCFYEYSLKNNKKQPRVLLSLIKIFYDINDYNKLKKYINIYLEENTSILVETAEIAYYVFVLGEKEKALDLALQAVESNPESSKAFSSLGFLQMNLENYNEAASAYEQSFSLKKENSILEDWSASLLKVEKFTKVKKVLEKNKDSVEYSSGIDCNLAVAYLNLDDNYNAKKILKETIKKDLKNSKPSALLANIYYKEKDFETAKEYINLALDIDKDNYEWELLKADILFDSGNTKESATLYKKVIDLNNMMIPRYSCYEAILLLEGNKLEESLKKCIESIKLEPEYWLSYKIIGDLYLKDNNSEAAIEYYEKAIDKNKEIADIWLKLHKLYSKKSKGLFKKNWKLKAKSALEAYSNLSKDN